MRGGGFAFLAFFERNRNVSLESCKRIKRMCANKRKEGTDIIEPILYRRTC